MAQAESRTFNLQENAKFSNFFNPQPSLQSFSQAANNNDPMQSNPLYNIFQRAANEKTIMNNSAPNNNEGIGDNLNSNIDTNNPNNITG